MDTEEIIALLENLKRGQENCATGAECYLNNGDVGFVPCFLNAEKSVAALRHAIATLKSMQTIQNGKNVYVAVKPSPKLLNCDFAATSKPKQKKFYWEGE